ncbi:aminotransferase class I/II-fold pyridoxal phosphate-dependent enzyme [Agrobacterium vitis]|uniref:Aminotransferase class I/II-fold pyridoxal phosphate-dependent enzyme n=1 Tax=Agrobacterium vitis TaxID=373 RepID=A0ABW9TL31_AGRVI|nr:aminotransferase class I/II-fold pyridoxal phosphate-dependent enzyme [Agrobacterium vitis]MUO43034.1 aminotransferase class I/II-fold pyridoxal phosphate-dependent enzyme [Agrobacterium vitis]
MYPGANLGPAWLAARIVGRTPKNIIESVMRLVDSGELPAGSQLPTVRQFAALMHISSATVVEAWANLRASGYLETKRRGGTIVRQRPGSIGSGTSGIVRLDLSQAVARPELQPDLGAALMAGLQVATLHRGEREYITHALRDAVMPTWPFKAEAWLAAAGGAEGNYSAIAATLGPNRHVALEHPTSPSIIEALEKLGARMSPVACDRDGPLPQALETALENGADSFIYQPCAQTPLGHVVPPYRLTELASVLQSRPQVLVAELDTAGPLACDPGSSIALYLPARVLYVRAYCKTYGIDLKTSIIAGSQTLVERVIGLRSGGYSVTSRILQTALAWLLTDPQSIAAVDRARHYYAQRRISLIAALRQRGIECHSPDGLFVWLPVENEEAALLRLAGQGIEASSGIRCRVFPGQLEPHLRLSATTLPEQADFVDTLADVLAESAQRQPTPEAA